MLCYKWLNLERRFRLSYYHRLFLSRINAYLSSFKQKLAVRVNWKSLRTPVRSNKSSSLDNLDFKPDNLDFHQKILMCPPACLWLQNCRSFSELVIEKKTNREWALPLPLIVCFLWRREMLSPTKLKLHVRPSGLCRSSRQSGRNENISPHESERCALTACTRASTHHSTVMSETTLRSTNRTFWHSWWFFPSFSSIGAAHI